MPMVPFTICSPLTLISLIAGFVNAAANPVQPITNQLDQNKNNAAIVSSQPVHSSVRDFNESLTLSSNAQPDLPNDAHFRPSFSLPVPSQPSPGSDMGSVTAQEEALVGLINREREIEGLNQLTEDPQLAEIARSHSEDMSARNYFDHKAPEPGPVTPMDRYLAATDQKPSYAMVGENIFYRSNTDSISNYADQAHEAFMQSPGHRANVLKPEYTNVGVGIYRNPVTGEYWVTEMFLTTTQR
jgi:uncharacterized protein YkwD